MVTATSPLRSTSSPGSTASASSAACAIASTPRAHAVVEHHLTVDDPFEPVGADVVERRRSPACRPGTRPGGRSRPRRCPTAGRAAPARPAPPGGARRGRVVHDGRQRAVEVDERSAARRARAAKRQERTREGHGASVARLRAADDDDAVGVGRALGRVGRVRLVPSHRCRRRTARGPRPHVRTRRRTGRRCPGVPCRRLAGACMLYPSARSLSVSVCATPCTPDPL